MKYWIYTANVGTIVISCDEYRPYNNQKGRGIKLIGIQDSVLIKAKSSHVKQYFGKCDRKVSKNLNPELISQQDFITIFREACEIEERQQKIIEIRNKY